MKICLINNLFKPYNKGGAERIVELLEKELTALGHEVFGITTKPYSNNLSKKQLENFYYIKSFYYHLDKIPKFLRIFWHFFQFLDFYKFLRIKFILKKEKPAIVLTHNMIGLSFLSFFLFKKNKHIHFLHDIQLLHPAGLVFLGKENVVNSFLASFYQFFQKKMSSSVTTVVSPSKWLMEQHLEKGFFQTSKQIIRMNPSFIQDQTGGDIKKEYDFLFVGQIEKHKGVKELLTNFKKLNGNFSLAIVGDGSLLPSLKNEYLDPSILFLGKKNNFEVLDIMRRSRCLVYPSLCYENSPTTIYEAASVGLPVLSSSLGGSKELIEYFGGFLFNYLIENNFYNKLKYVVENPDKVEEVSIFSKKRAYNLYAQKYSKFIFS